MAIIMRTTPLLRQRHRPAVAVAASMAMVMVAKNRQIKTTQQWHVQNVVTRVHMSVLLLAHQDL